MKKTFPANINGTIFYIDEDAYNLLNTYLEQLRNAFPGDEGQEISTDIEGRISEHFTERINEGARVITIGDVNRIIKVMGEPAELAGDSENPAREGSATPPPMPGSTVTPPPYYGAASQQPVRKRLYRDPRNCVFGGVIGGLGMYLGWNVNLMRVLTVVLTLCTYFWPCVIAYLVAWMVIPRANTPRQLLEMQGAPVTLGNVGQTILGSADPAGRKIDTGSGVTNFFRIAGNVILGFLGLIGGCVGLGFIVMFFFILCALIMFLGWNDTVLMSAIDLQQLAHPALGMVAMLCMSLAVLLPCIAMVWGACCALFKVKGASKGMIITAVVLEVILITASIILFGVSELAATDPEELFTAISSSSQLLLA